MQTGWAHRADAEKENQMVLQKAKTPHSRRKQPEAKETEDGGTGLSVQADV
jgi:hypothetical protein